MTRPAAAEPDQALEELAAFHAQVDRDAGALAGRHAARLQCRRGCSACCVDGIRVFGVEAERIRREAGARLRGQAPHAAGACAFLDPDGACRVYAQRPYVCRSEGLPLRWIDSGSRPPVERRSMCPLNEPGGPPLEQLPEDACWTLGPSEGRLAAIQRRFAGGRLERVSLRALMLSLESDPPSGQEAD